MSDELSKNKELMATLREVGFEEFREDAKAVYAENIGEWQVTYFRHAYFHFHTRKIAAGDLDAVFQAAFEYLRRIALHDGNVNICGAFIGGCEIVSVFNRQGNYAEIRLAFSAITNLWHWGVSYMVQNGFGGGFAPGISEGFKFPDYSANTRDDAIVAASRDLYETFDRARRGDRSQSITAIAAAACEAIETRVLEILSKSPSVPIPDFIAAKNIVVQQSLF